MDELFYIPNDQITEGKIAVSGDDYHHIIRVKRFKENDEVFFANGEGKFYRTKINQIRKHDFDSEIVEITDIPFPLKKRLNVYVGVLKNKDRLEWIVEKCGEFSVSSLTPVNTEFTVKSHLNIERLQKISISALKQSKNSYLMMIKQVNGLSQSLKRNPSVLNLVLHEKRMSESQKLIDIELESFLEINLFVGPEGGFSEKEIKLFSDQQASFAWMGEQRLRTETAAVAAVGILNQLLQK